MGVIVLAFFAESLRGSKLCFYNLDQGLHANGFLLKDAQVHFDKLMRQDIVNRYKSSARGVCLFPKLPLKLSGSKLDWVQYSLSKQYITVPAVLRVLSVFCTVPE